jgi:hypothetical protein
MKTHTRDPLLRTGDKTNQPPLSGHGQFLALGNYLISMVVVDLPSLVADCVTLKGQLIELAVKWVRTLAQSCIGNAYHTTEDWA